MIEFFITVLLNVSIMGIDPPRGWLQGTEPYATQEQCVDAIEEHIQEIHMSVYEWTR